MQQYQMPNLTKTNRIVLYILVGSFVLNSILTHILNLPMAYFLGLSSASFFSGFIFQIITYPLANLNLMDVLFSGLLFWFLGSELEGLWGSRKYRLYLILTVLFAGFCYLIFSTMVKSANGYPFSGLGVLSSAMCVSYAVCFPDRIFQFFMLIPIKAKYFCMILAAMSLYQGIFTPAFASSFGNLSAMGFGFIFMALEKQPFFNKLVRPKMVKKSTSKANLRIVSDDENKPPRYFQ